ncbi:MAG: GlxA family transcriptional regulator [Pseudomonadota bacterium]
MSAPHTIIMVVYDGFELLDLAGPNSVFFAANSLTGESHYRASVHSIDGGPVTASCGVVVATEKLPASRVLGRDTTVLVVGSEGDVLLRAMKCQPLLDFLRCAAEQSQRCGSVCSGAFILAAAGVLDGRRAATHWAGRQAFNAWFKKVTLDHDALYVVDGSIWTSAGVTTGIDMSLAIVEADFGAILKGRIARHLVVYAHRPGNQTQFSCVLAAQINSENRFGPLVNWIQDNLADGLTVADMARQANMSERNFHRKFKDATGEAPGRFLLSLQMEQARHLLANNAPVKTVAPQVGFASETAFRTAFKKYFGVVPSHLAAAVS